MKSIRSFIRNVPACIIAAILTVLALFGPIHVIANDRLMEGVGRDSGDYQIKAEIKYTQRSVTNYGRVEDTNCFLYGVDLNLAGKKGEEGLHLGFQYRDGTGSRYPTSGMESLPHQPRPEPYFQYDEKSAETDEYKIQVRQVFFLAKSENSDKRLEFAVEYEKNATPFRGNGTEIFNHLQTYSNDSSGDYGWILGWTTISHKVPDYLNLSMEFSSNSTLNNGNKISVFVRLEHQEMLGEEMDEPVGCLIPQSRHPHDGSGTSLTIGFRHQTKLSEQFYLRVDGSVGCDDGTHGYDPGSYSFLSFGPEWRSPTGHSAITLLVNAFSPIQDRGDGRGDECVWFSLGWRFWF